MTDIWPCADPLFQSIARIKGSPFIPHKDQVRGFVFDVATGKLNEVVLTGPTG